MKKQYPVRTCIGCGEADERVKLLRLVRNENGDALFDPARTRPGRGAWVHADPECIRRGLDPRRLSRAFRGRTRAGESLKDRLTAAVRNAD